MGLRVLVRIDHLVGWHCEEESIRDIVGGFGRWARTFPPPRSSFLVLFLRPGQYEDEEILWIAGVVSGIASLTALMVKELV